MPTPSRGSRSCPNRWRLKPAYPSSSPAGIRQRRPLQKNSLERESIRRNSLSLQMAVHGALAFAREKMMFKRNMGPKERVARMVFGALLICTGVVAMHSSALGIAVAAVGGVSLITGIFSYCPACAVAGREPTASSR
jgi:hypothetical protein